MIAAALLWLAQAGQPQVDCAEPMTQSAMNICSYRDYRAAEAALKIQWQRARAFAKDMDRRSSGTSGDPPDNFARLLDAQRKWLAYRDAHCLAVNGPRTQFSGTIWPLLQNNCMEDLTRARTGLLRQYADQPN